MSQEPTNFICIECGQCPQNAVRRKFNHLTASFCDITCEIRFRQSFWTPLMGRSSQTARRPKKSKHARRSYASAPQKKEKTHEAAISEAAFSSVPPLALSEKQYRKLERLKRKYNEAADNGAVSDALLYEDMMQRGQDVLSFLQKRRDELHRADEWLRREAERFEAQVNSIGEKRIVQQKPRLTVTLAPPKKPPTNNNSNNSNNDIDDLYDYVTLNTDGTFQFGVSRPLFGAMTRLKSDVLPAELYVVNLSATERMALEQNPWARYLGLEGLFYGKAVYLLYPLENRRKFTDEERNALEMALIKNRPANSNNDNQPET